MVKRAPVRGEELSNCSRGCQPTAGPAASASPAPTGLFSERDFAIFRLVPQEGLTNQQIAYRLGLKEDAVKKSVRRIFRRTGVASRAEAVRWRLANKDESGVEK